MAVKNSLNCAETMDVFVVPNVLITCTCKQVTEYCYCCHCGGGSSSCSSNGSSSSKLKSKYRFNTAAMFVHGTKAA